MSLQIRILVAIFLISFISLVTAYFAKVLPWQLTLASIVLLIMTGIPLIVYAIVRAMECNRVKKEEDYNKYLVFDNPSRNKRRQHNNNARMILAYDDDSSSSNSSSA